MRLRSCTQTINLNSDNSFIKNVQKNQLSLDSNHEVKHDTTEQTIAKVQIKKKIHKKKMRQVKFEDQKIDNFNEAKGNIFLSHGLSISSQGIIRFCYSLNHFSFGYSNYNACRSDYTKNNDILEFQLSTENKLKKFSFNEAIQFMSRTNCKDFIQTSNTLKKFLDYQEKTYDINFSQRQSINSIEEQNKHFQICKEYIQEYTKISQNSIYQYAIGSLNYQKKDFDIFSIGYSKPYLDLLGIDIDNFVRTLLRHQQIDLHQNDEEILKQSLLGLQTNVFEQSEVDLAFLINTYDGFPLRIQGKKRNIKLNFDSQNQKELNKEFLLLFTEFDIDFQQLQRLIEYRQNILNKRKDLSYDDFINKELSYMFEDVEYSVHSQSFIEKFYLPNIQNLNYLNQQYQQRQQQIHTKQCSYKQINIQQQNIL
ncbi:hypothetical protein ABPG72_000768 [Tetrahymena utriculariae]